MGSIIDLERKDQIYRCNYVKRAIVYINLILPPISLLLLVLGILRMILIKKRKSFLTNLILMIFSSEIVQCLSKLIQLLKYDYQDSRIHKDSIDLDNPRGIICQIQIISALFSDYLSLLSTLLLSIRCYDVIFNRKRFFDKGKNGLLSMIFIAFLSSILALIFLFIDRKRASGNISYRFDVRDRCSYWCWLEHTTSLYCYGLYWAILICNIVFACITNNYLKKGYKKLLEENKLIPNKVNDLKNPLNEEEKEYGETSCEKEERSMNNLTIEEKKRIEQLKLLKAKCLIYPTVTISYWLFAATYRVIDDIFMSEYDSAKDPLDGEEKEKEFFEDNKSFQILVQTFLVIYTVLSSIRGILYGFSFIVFEEKIFFNFFKKIWKLCFKDDDLEINDEEGKGIIRNTDGSSSITDINVSKNKDDNKTIEMNSKDNNE